MSRPYPRHSNPDRQRAMARAVQAALRELRRRHPDEYSELYRKALADEGVGPLPLGEARGRVACSCPCHRVGVDMLHVLACCEYVGMKWPT